MFLTIGPPSDAAELVAIERRLSASRGLKKPVAFIDVSRRNSQALPCSRLRAAAVVDVDGRAGGAAVLRAHVVGDDLELADRVRRRLHHLVREALVARAVGVVVDAVDQEVVEHAAQAVDVERAFARRVARASATSRRACTPVVSSASDEYSRPFSGSARVCSPVITWPRWLESVSTSGGAAVTSTFSVTWPTGICRSTRSRAPTWTCTLSTRRDREPGFSAVTT